MSVRTAVILAAERGKSLAGAHIGPPRGFFEIAGEPVIERSLRLLRSRGIEQVVIVTGYEAEAYRALARRSSGLETVHDGAFAGAGSMASLAQALDVVEDEFLLLESHLYYEPRALDLLLESSMRDVLLAAGETHTGDEVYVEAPLGRLTFMSKKRAEVAFYSGEYVGICRLSRALAEAMRAELDAFVREHGHARMAYDTDALNVLARERHVAVHVVPDLLWAAIHDAAQLARLRDAVAPHMHAREQHRVHGERRVLFSPGPTTTSQSVKAALLIADVSPREPSFCARYKRVRDALSELAGDPAQLATVPVVGSGVSALEAMFTSFVGPGDRLLIIDNGDHGTRLGSNGLGPRPKP